MPGAYGGLRRLRDLDRSARAASRHLRTAAVQVSRSDVSCCCPVVMRRTHVAVIGSQLRAREFRDDFAMHESAFQPKCAAHSLFLCRAYSTGLIVLPMKTPSARPLMTVVQQQEEYAGFPPPPMTTSNQPSPNPLVARIKARKAARRKREAALLLVALGFAVAAFVFQEPILILVSVFPALASYSQR